MKQRCGNSGVRIIRPDEAGPTLTLGTGQVDLFLLVSIRSSCLPCHCPSSYTYTARHYIRIEACLNLCSSPTVYTRLPFALTRSHPCL